MDRTKVLVVDDDKFFLRFCADTLTRAGLEVITASSEDDVLALCAQEPVALVLADVFMPRKSGIELLEEIKSLYPSIDVIVTTGYASVETAVQALKKGASDYLRKPFPPEELRAAVGGILAQRRLYQDNEELKKQLRLYELSRSFAAVEEPLRVAALGLDALREITGTRTGFCVVFGEDGSGLNVSASRNLESTEAKALADVLPLLAEMLLAGGGIRMLADGDLAELFTPPAFGNISNVLVIPFGSEKEVLGSYFLLTREMDPRLGERSLTGAEFLGGQVSIAYKAALRFQEAKGMAYVDSLTDLFNARYLQVILEKRIAEAKDSGKPLSMLFLDLDNFKDVNTNFGHLAGSKTLIEVGWILESNVRGGDTVIRYGGDEFTIVLPNTDTESAREIAERIRKAIMNQVFLGREGKSIRLTACIGVGTYPKDANTPELLINMADQAMYRGKGSTRNVVHVAKTG